MTTQAPPTTAPNAAAILARKRTAAAGRASDLIEHWLHHLDDGPLYTLATAAYAEIGERERTRARAQGRTTYDSAGG